MIKSVWTVILMMAFLAACAGGGNKVDGGGDAVGGDGDHGYDHDHDHDYDHDYDDGMDGADDGGGDGDIQGDDATSILSLSSVEPAQGGASVRTTVSLLGTGFADGIEVYVGGVAATDVAIVNGEEATAVFGAVEPIECGKKDVRAVLGGEESVLPEGFEYLFDEDPIVFVHGYLMTSAEWNGMTQSFRDRGYPEDRLFAIDYSSSLDSNIVHARDELAPFIDDVLLQTGAERVDLVGHSNGGMSSRLYVVFHGGHEKVRDFVSVAGTHHGSDMACLAGWTGESAEEQCPAYANEQESHNGVQWMLNGDPDTPDIDETPHGVEDGGPVAYTALWTEDDLIVVPAHSCCLNQQSRGDCGDAINVMFSGVGHIEMASNPDVIDTVFDHVRRRNVNNP